MKFDDADLGQAGVGDFLADQVGRHHAHHLAAGGERRVGDRAHQADTPAAIDRRQPRPGDQRACAGRFLQKSWVISGGRTAINANTFHKILPLSVKQPAKRAYRDCRLVSRSGWRPLIRQLQNVHGRHKGRPGVDGRRRFLYWLGHANGDGHGQVVQHR